jgi:hypothetical protein
VADQQPLFAPPIAVEVVRVGGWPFGAGLVLHEGNRHYRVLGLLTDGRWRVRGCDPYGAGKGPIEDIAETPRLKRFYEGLKKAIGPA